MWNIYNAALDEGESIRAFPLSNWTELDIWLYILQEQIELVPLYFAKPRPVLRRDGMWIMRDDERMPLQAGEEPEEKWVRFRTLGCYPLTGAIESRAMTLEDVVAETVGATTSERQGRAIDQDQSGMEQKKREGYF